MRAVEVLQAVAIAEECFPELLERLGARAGDSLMEVLERLPPALVERFESIARDLRTEFWSRSDW